MCGLISTRSNQPSDTGNCECFSGSSDIGYWFARGLYGQDPAGWAAQSPLSYADSISTPMLIIHSEQDWRCPVEQAQRLYVALKLRGRPAELLLFPGEGHELSRSGLPSHRVARFDAILEWFDRWVKAAKRSSPASRTICRAPGISRPSWIGGFTIVRQTC